MKRESIETRSTITDSTPIERYTMHTNRKSNARVRTKATTRIVITFIAMATFASLTLSACKNAPETNQTANANPSPNSNANSQAEKSARRLEQQPALLLDGQQV